MIGRDRPVQRSVAGYEAWLADAASEVARGRRAADNNVMTLPPADLYDRQTLPFVTRLLDTAPHGALTVIDQDALPRHDLALEEIACCLQDLTGAAGQPLVWVDCGGGKHGTGQWLARNFGTPNFIAVNDYDPDFEPFAEFPADGVDPALDLFGTPTLTCVANRLLRVKGHQRAVVVLDDPAGARPYADVGARQLSIDDDEVRVGARHATFTWRADDLCLFAGTRPQAPTICVTHDEDPGRLQLLDRAALVLPRPCLAAVT